MAIQLNTIGIVVRDMGASLAFYRTLGLDIPTGTDGEANVEIALPNGITLGFLAEEMARQADPTFVEPVGQRMNLQFVCETPAEVDATHAKLVGAGYASHTDPWDAYWGQRFARVSDPDGNVVNLFA
jgi:catechol 2,3-dioxygenase-like lactoylglutathione lyase family enzyme